MFFFLEIPLISTVTEF